jgi:hypothetical protein
MESDPMKWDGLSLENIRATPWMLKAAPQLDQQVDPASSDGVRRILPMSLRPLTPGCAACAHRGVAGHGHRHSVECQRRRTDWLSRQVEPPLADATPERERGQHPVEGVTSTSTSAGGGSASSSSSTMPESLPAAPAPAHRLREKTPEAEVATTARKRTSEMPLPTLEEEEREVPGEDVHMQLICALEEELADLDIKDERQIRLENGVDWAPESWTKAGDVKEMQGLFDQGVLKPSTEKEAAGYRFISSKVVRLMKRGAVKSRLVLRDIARSAPEGGELFASTPALA